jgi:hypothetical protein
MSTTPGTTLELEKTRKNMDSVYAYDGMRAAQYVGSMLIGFEQKLTPNKPKNKKQKLLVYDFTRE